MSFSDDDCLGWIRSVLPEAQFLQHPLLSNPAHLFARQAAAFPESIAVKDGPHRYTYAEIAARSASVSAELLARGVVCGDYVAIFSCRGVEMIVGILAVLRIRAAFYLMDPALPQDRLEGMIQRIAPKALLTSGASARSLENFSFQTEIQLNISTAAERSQIAGFSALPLSGAPGNWTDPAYVFFTSGSTGQPKAAEVAYGGMLNHLFAKISDLNIGPGEVVAQTAASSFDIVVWQCVAPLMTGASIVVIGPGDAMDPSVVIDLIQKDRISVLEVVPSFLGLLLDEIERRGEPPAMPSLRVVFSNAERLSADMCRRWLARYPNVILYNSWGITECSDDVTHQLVASSPAPGEVDVPVGRVIPNASVYVLDETRQMVKTGQVGELYVGGLAVGLGYKGDAERTNEAFVIDPFSRADRPKMYKTGDLGRMRPDGTLEFIGRRDSQVKIRGHRVELGEIEMQLAAHSAVLECAVVAPGAGATRTLNAYVVRRTSVLSANAVGPSISYTEADLVTDIKHYLSAKLPEYMIPSTISVLESIPRTATGKTDRKTLEGWHLADSEVLPADRPRGPIEEFIAELWMGALGLKTISRSANFFSLGGHSWLAASVIGQLRQRFRINLSMRAHFTHPTIADLASLAHAAMEAGPQKAKTIPEARSRHAVEP